METWASNSVCIRLGHRGRKPETAAPILIILPPTDIEVRMPEVAANASRCFSAVVWKRDEAAPLRALQDAVRAIHAEAPLRWTEPNDLHLTLRFYGDVDQATQGRLVDQLRARAATTPASTLDFMRLETWPPIRPRVVVARFRVEPSLTRLQASLERAARDAGFAPEPRQFQPHVTLARAPQGWNGGLARVKFATFALPASEIALWYKSLQPESNAYLEAWRQPLAAPAATHDL